MGDGNIYLLRGGRFDVLIDCGGNRDVRLLERNIRLAGSDPERVGQVWLTHSHSDHAGGAAAWQKRHPRTLCCLAAVAAKLMRQGNYRLVGTAAIGGSFEAPARLRPLQSGRLLRCGQHELTVVPLPGHAPDCLGYRGQVDGIDCLFSGDAIIGDQGKAKGVVGWLDGLWLSSVPTYVQTLQAVLARPPELLLPGHGYCQAGPAVRPSLKNCIARLRKVQAIPHAGTMFPFMG
jgi:glyoxylase-like metal-dependent hydrolase (beta-lactamase superfamily II)